MRCHSATRCATWGLLATRVRAKTKNLITLAGLRPEVTSLTWNNSSTKIDHHQASRVIETGNFRCGTVIVEGEDFITETITFEKFSPEPLVVSKCSGQAVAIRVTADWYAFYNCLFIGWQDTLYLHYGKQYLKDCYIEGYVDFIFGNSTTLLEHCHIQCKSAGLLIAQSIKSSQESTGYVFPRVVWLGDPILVLLAFVLVMVWSALINYRIHADM
ncbi:hypothetical protein POTOM_055049 [Populus tomentosa]|uniref:pectinesterase n=1 Tax=Populus tomentosa TaxID=118781 RepID=A0A8X8C5H6_POPTO|nr:hypothetical protein POTOM_055049 [Populus tomentosa]